MSQDAAFEVAFQAWNRVTADENNEDSHCLSSSLQHLRNAIENKPLSWTSAIAAELTPSLVHTATRFLHKQPRIAIESLQIINNTLEQWNASMVYQSMVANDELFSLYEVLSPPSSNCDINTNRAIQGHIIMILEKWWLAAECIRTYTAVDGINSNSILFYEGHLRQDHLEQIALMAIHLITSKNETEMELDDAWSMLDLCEARAASVSFLTGLLRKNISGWLLRQPQDTNTMVSKLCRCLLPEVQLLNDNDSTGAACHLGLASLSLLSLIQRMHPHHLLTELDSFLQTTNIVQHLTLVAFSMQWPSPGGPKWTLESTDMRVQQLAIGVIHTWSSIPGGEAWSTFIERMEEYWSSFCRETWTCVLEASTEKDQTKLENVVPALYFLHTHLSCRPSAHNALMKILRSQQAQSSEDACGRLLSSLCSLSQHRNFIISVSSTALLNVLLSQRKNTSTHDEVSRILWKEIDIENNLDSIDVLMSQALELSNHEESAYKIRLTCILSTVETLFASPVYCQRVLFYSKLDKLSSMVAFLIGIITQTTRDSTTTDISHSMHEEDTPKIGNTQSKPAYTWSNHRQATPDTIAEATPLHFTNQLVAATILSSMGCIQFKEIELDREYMLEELCLIQANIRSTLHEFVLGIPSLLCNTYPPCREMTQRLARLYTMLATSSGESENLVASAMFATDMARTKDSAQKIDDLADCKRQVEEITTKVNELLSERDGYKREVDSKQFVHDREIHCVRLQASSDASRMIEVHATERSRAEIRTSEFAKQTSQAHVKQKEAESTAEAARACGDLARSDLMKATSKIKELEQLLQEQRSIVNVHESRGVQMSRELVESKEHFKTIQSRQILTDNQLSVAEKSLSDVQGMSNHLQDDLENTYSNLASSAHLYQMKEEDLSNMREENTRKTSEAKKKLEAERHRNEELEDNTLRIRRDNEKLERKLVRAKEKIDEERRERRQEQERRKRNGPVSYINQLRDDSMISVDKSGRDRPIRDRSTHSGKENDYLSSQSKQRNYR